jgi:hypothetical protein
MRKRMLRPFSEETARRLALIFGPQSASAMALEDLRLRRERGESVALFEDANDQNALWVGPPPPEATKEGK